MAPFARKSWTEHTPAEQAGGCLILLIGAIWLSSCDCDCSDTTSPARKSRPLIGDLGVLSSEDGYDVPVAISQETWNRLYDLSVAHDADGIGEMRIMGLVFGTPSGTGCRVIDSGIFSYEVRLTDGLHDGQYCFVSSNFVHDR